MWSFNLPTITKIPVFQCDKDLIESFFESCSRLKWQNFLNIDDLSELAYGATISIGINEFRPLKMYDNLPNTFHGVLKTILEMREDFAPGTSIPFVYVTDIAFFKLWWQSLPFLENKATFGKKCKCDSHGSMKAYDKVCFLWGNFHCWLKAMGYCWNTWKDVTKWLFNILFPGMPWWSSPTSANLIQFYSTIFVHAADMLVLLAQFATSDTLSNLEKCFLKRLRDFLQHVVPTLHYYYHALKHNNNSSFRLLQRQLFKIILFCNAREYSKCFVFNYFLQYAWRNTQFQHLFDQHWLLNEEIGESSLSILARSVISCPQSAKQAKLKENFVLIPRMRQLQSQYHGEVVSNNEQSQIKQNNQFLNFFIESLESLDIEPGPTNLLENYDYYTNFKLLFDSVYCSWILPSPSIENVPNTQSNILLLEKIWSSFS